MTGSTTRLLLGNQESAKYLMLSIFQTATEDGVHFRNLFFQGDWVHAAPPGRQPGAGADAARETGQQGGIHIELHL